MVRRRSEMDYRAGTAGIHCEFFAQNQMGHSGRIRHEMNEIFPDRFLHQQLHKPLHSSPSCHLMTDYELVYAVLPIFVLECGAGDAEDHPRIIGHLDKSPFKLHELCPGSHTFDFAPSHTGLKFPRPSLMYQAIKYDPSTIHGHSLGLL
jgi:hypothetical protein